jgi:SAM-dependent methyltransferase
MDAKRFDRVARELFGKVYPVIAEQIKERTGITYGNCLDIGAGGGYLGIALTKITDLKITLLDRSREMLAIAARNVADNSLNGRINLLLGDVDHIPLPDNSIDLVISRGSLFFWEDQQAAFSEIHRILSPTGVAYIGGGLGNGELAGRIRAELKRRGYPGPGPAAGSRHGRSVQSYEETLRNAGISSFAAKRNEEGFWIVMRKAV